MRPGSTRGRPWPRGHLGGQGGLAALRRETRALYMRFDHIISTRAVQQRAAAALPLLLQQERRGALVRVTGPAFVWPGRRAGFCSIIRVERLIAA